MTFTSSSLRAAAVCTNTLVNNLSFETSPNEDVEDDGDTESREEEEEVKNYSRRKIVSNWNRYEDAEKEGQRECGESQRGTDFSVLLSSAVEFIYLFIYFRTDGSFVVHDVPSGSYVVEVISPAHKFEPVRVDITSKGKMRARYVNYIKTSEVVRLPYPLQMKSSGPPSYFIKRESWGWTDFLMNPMVVMMVLPLLIFVLLPKVVNTSDPDMRREMEQSMNMLNSNHELPDVSEFMTRLFSSKSSSKSGGSSSKAGKSSSGKRR
ncbi:ER membrane protein complex subunit 7 [Meleagris gallopavo]|nr:ER membrane protein complex subunit 7 [Meleagris gallopavo]